MRDQTDRSDRSDRSDKSGIWHSDPESGPTLEERAAVYALAVRITRIVESDGFADEVLVGARATEADDYGQVFRCQVTITLLELRDNPNLDALARVKCQNLLTSLKHAVRPQFLAAWPSFRFRRKFGPTSESAELYVLGFQWEAP
mgnify:CR=1 FL=1